MALIDQATVKGYAKLPTFLFGTTASKNLDKEAACAVGMQIKATPFSLFCLLEAVNAEDKYSSSITWR